MRKKHVEPATADIFALVERKKRQLVAAMVLAEAVDKAIGDEDRPDYPPHFWKDEQPPAEVVAALVAFRRVKP